MAHDHDTNGHGTTPAGDEHAPGEATSLLNDLRDPTKRLRRHIKDVYKGFYTISQSVMSDGALSVKHKELIALALAVSEHCNGCIAYHAKAVARQGATEEEVAEALGVTVLLGGGPASSDYAPRALAAFLEFADPDQTAD